MPLINNNNFRLFDKNKGNKRRFEIHEVLDDDLLLEKYNQTSKINYSNKDLKKLL